MKLSRSYAKRLVLANWNGIIFHCFDLDRHVTGLEGVNGSGKSAVLAGYLTAIIPNLKLLSFKGVNGAPPTRGDSGLWGRIGSDGVCYAMIEWMTPRSTTFWAGVAMTRGNMPTIDVKYISIHGTPPEASPYDVMLLRTASDWTIPPLGALREQIAMHGGRLTTHKTLMDYMRSLFEQGITPMPMTTLDEQERFYRVLSTSMEGSALATVIKTGLRDYLLPADTSLERRVALMRESLDQCRKTKRELERANDAHKEIAGLYDAAWRMASYAYFGARGRYEQEEREWREQAASYRAAIRTLGERKAAVAHLQSRVTELEVELDAAEKAVSASNLHLLTATQAHMLRSRLEEALGAHGALEAAAERTAAVHAQAEADERKAVAALESAQQDQARIAAELADVQLAAEGLIRRVTDLRTARARLSVAQAAVQPARLDRDNAASMAHEVGQQYEAATRRHVAALAEMDALSDHETRFETLLDRMKLIARDAGWDEPAACDAYEYALTLDAHLRDQRARANLAATLQEDLARARVRARQQTDVRRAAAALGIDSTAALARATHTTLDTIVRLDSERERLASDLATRQDALIDIRARLPGLEDAARRFGEAEQWRMQIGALIPAWRAIETLEVLTDSADAGRQQLATVEAMRHASEARLRDTEERIRTLDHCTGSVDPRLGTVAEHVEGRLLASRFDDLTPEVAAQTQARLGSWTEAIVVRDPAHAAQIAVEFDDRPEDVLFVSADVLDCAMDGQTIGDSELVPEQRQGVEALRLTRRPTHPVLGRRARELEIARLRSCQAAQEAELNDLREQSRLWKQALLLVERLRALGAIAWGADPRPAVQADHQAVRALSLQIEESKTALGQLRQRIADTDLTRQRLLALEADRSLLDPPEYADEAAGLEQSLQAARAAQAWVTRHGRDVTTILEGLPILATGLNPARREAVQAERDKYGMQRERLAHQRDALEELMTVIEHLEHEQDELDYNAQASMIEQLRAKTAPARARVEGATAELAGRRRAYEVTRRDYSAALAKRDQSSEQCRKFSDDLSATGLAGTQEEADAASEAHVASVQTLQLIKHEYQATNTAFIEGRTKLENLDNEVKAQKHAAAGRVATLRYERKAQRDVDRVVEQLRLHGRIDSDLNRQQHFPTGSQINAFQSSQNQQTLLLERLKPWPEVALDLKRIEGFSEPSGERRAILTLRAWDRVRKHIEQRIPRNLASADDPVVALAQMTEKMGELQRTLAAQEEEMRTRSAGLADGITARLRSARSIVARLNSQLRPVSFGSIRGLNIAVTYPDDMTKMLECLKRENSLSLFDAGAPLEDALARLYERETGGAIQGHRLFDYRNYLTMRLEVQRISGKWEATSEVSVGEGIGTGAAVLIMIMRTWNEEANRISGTSGHAMQQILLDEANRLDEHSLGTLTEFCQRMDVQALVAAPVMDKPRRSTVFQLSRALRGKEEFVTIRGTRITA